MKRELSAMQNEKTLLETVLDIYDQRLQHYFANDIEGTVCEKRKAEFEAAKVHLQQQRKHLEVVASIQCKLDEYREQGRKVTSGMRSDRRAGIRMLEVEPHHPTTLLTKFLLADGKPKPSPNHSAHHIVPGKGRLQETYIARVHMHTRGIRINDPDNGVWLPMHRKHTPHWSMPNAKAHLQYHTKEYEYNIAARIRTKGTEKLVRYELNFIGKLMQETGQIATQAELNS